MSSRDEVILFKPYSDFVANVRLNMNPKETDPLPSFPTNSDGDDGGGVVVTTVEVGVW